MEYVIGAIVVVVLWFMWSKRRGDAYVRTVAEHVGDDLRASGEPESAIRAYLRSADFSILAKSSFGQQAPIDAIVQAIGNYRTDPDRWRGIGSKYGG